MTLLTIADLKKMGVHYSTQHLNRLIKAGEFPKAIKFGSAPNSRKAWLQEDIEQWLKGRVSVRDGDAA
jgi:prophage regulatory protein